MSNLNFSHKKNYDIASIDRSKLVDIRDVKVNIVLPKTERAKDFIRQIGDPYCYLHGKYVVIVGFADTDITLENLLSNHMSLQG